MDRDPVLYFRKTLCDTINQDELPISIKYYIVKDVFEEVQDVYNQYVARTPIETEEKTETKTFEIPKEVQEQMDGGAE